LSHLSITFLKCLTSQVSFSFHIIIKILDIP